MPGKYQDKSGTYMLGLLTYYFGQNVRFCQVNNMLAR